MSNYRALTYHPVTGKLEEAEWLDNYHGPHGYGVRFPDERVYLGIDCEQVGPKAGEHIASLAEENKRLREAAIALLNRYTELANSGDCGFWDPEEETEVIALRAALAAGEK